MKKSVFLLLGILAQSFSFNAFANDCSNPYKSHNFYLGASLGVGFFDYKPSDNVTTDAPFIENVSHSKKKTSNRNINGGGILGYIYKIGKFGIGSELDWQKYNLNQEKNYHFDDSTLIEANVNEKINLSNQISVKIKSGFFVKDLFCYGLLGVTRSSLSSNCLFKEVGGANALRLFSFNKKVKGLKFGLGLEKRISDNYVLGIELVSDKLKSIRYDFSLDPTTAVNSQQHSTIRNLNIYSANLRLMYIF
jgi:Outer membrane protein beta-barrel domain